MHGPQTAVVCLSGVQYYTGQKFDMKTITHEAQAQVTQGLYMLISQRKLI